MKGKELLSGIWDLAVIILCLCAAVLSYIYIEALNSIQWSSVLKEVFTTRSISAFPIIAIYPIIGALLLWAVLTLVNPLSRSLSYGTAHWAKLKDIIKMELLAPAGLIIGIYNGRYLRYDKDLSALLIAPPGTGKTSAIVIPILLSEERSMFVHDVKDELYAITSKRRASMGKVIRFAPANSDSDSFNPFDKQYIKPILEDNIALVNQVAVMLIKEQSGKVDNWVRDARNLFKVYSLYLLWKHGQTSLPEIRDFSLSDPEPKELLFELLEKSKEAEEEGADPMPRELEISLNRSVSKPDREFGAVHGTMTGFLEIFAEPNIAKTFSKSDFTLSELRESCSTVYLHVPVSDIERLSPLIAMFFEMVGNYLLSNPRKKGQQRVLFLLDEFIWLGKMPSMIKLPSLSRGEGVSTLFVCQSDSQIESLYDIAAVNTLKGTCAYRIILPQNEEKTAESIAKAIGDETRTKVSTSHQTGSGSSSQSISGEGHKLIRAQELLSMKEKECIILAQNHFQTPIRAKQCRWYEDKNMKNLNGSI